MSDLEPIRDVEFRNAVNELRKIVNNSNLDVISSYCSGCDTILDFGSFTFNIDTTGIWCYDYFNHKTLWIDESIPFRKAKTHFKEEAKLSLPDSSFKLYFLENLEDLKSNIKRKIEEATQNKIKGFKDIDDITLELSKEQKQEEPLVTINMIDFGYRTVEIITDGNVVLVDKRQHKPKLIDAETLLISQLMYDVLTENNKGVSKCATHKKKNKR